MGIACNNQSCGHEIEAQKNNIQERNVWNIVSGL